MLVPMVQVGMGQQAGQILDVMAKRCDKALNYYFSQGNRFENEIQLNLFTLQQLMVAAQQMNLPQKSQQLETTFRKYYTAAQQGWQ